MSTRPASPNNPSDPAIPAIPANPAGLPRPSLGGAKPPEPVAVIDIGTSAVRMTVAEVSDGGHLRILDELEHPVNLGKNTFINGTIGREAVEKCVEIIESFKRAAMEYGAAQNLRAVATTAVREANNRREFLDRLFIATGVDIQVVDEGETTRLIYNSIFNTLAHKPGMATAPVMVLDVGAGMTEALLLKNLRVAGSFIHRLGSLRLRALLQRYDAPIAGEVEVLGNQAHMMLEAMHYAIPRQPHLQIAVIGGDMQFAAARLVPEWAPGTTVEIPLARVRDLAAELLPMTVEHLVRTFGMSIPDAETVGPTLEVVCRVAESYGVDTLTIAKATLLGGVLQEVAIKNEWSQAFISQIEEAGIELAKKYSADVKHGRCVASLAERIFDALLPQHKLGNRERVLLKVAGFVHEVGLFVSNRAHHKHSYYLIDNSHLFGLSREQIRVVALVSRYHRRATPKTSHEGYGSLDREGRMLVNKLAAIHRVADALDRTQAQRIRDIHCEIDGDTFWITASGVQDFSVENLALKEKGNLMQQVYGLKPVLRHSR